MKLSIKIGVIAALWAAAAMLVPAVASAHDHDDPNQKIKIIGDDCDNSKLKEHDGLQKAPRCVTTEMGEVSEKKKNPTLLITSAPTEVKVGQPFDLRVSARNLVRDRFLGAAAGGYYRESSFLNDDGIQRGHVHTACTHIETSEAPDPTVDPDAFVATEDSRGGEGVSSFTVHIDGLKSPGVYRCASWAGDGSHRIPMMQFATETPAMDTVRVTVK